MPNVEDTSYMFYGCSQLSKMLNIKTPKVQNIAQMYRDCNLIEVSGNLIPNTVTNASGYRNIMKTTIKSGATRYHHSEIFVLFV